MNGTILLPFALLAAALGSVICAEIWTERLFTPFQWLSQARYPRGFPLIIGCQIIAFLALILLGILLSFGSS
jgi:hypothetical protein